MMDYTGARGASFSVAFDCEDFFQARLVNLRDAFLLHSLAKLLAWWATPSKTRNGSENET